MIFFTGDTHFGHKNVIEYAGRPFASADEMDAEMVRRWNTLVKPGDDIYHVGDFALCHPRKALEIVRLLNGRKHLVWGNHDKSLRKDKAFLAEWQWTKEMAEIKAEDADAHDGVRRIVLCHYAMRVWNKSHYGTWQLYGHSHGSLPDDPHALSLDVGVDCWSYAPASYDEIKQRMNAKEWRPVDHHERRE